MIQSFPSSKPVLSHYLVRWHKGIPSPIRCCFPSQELERVDPNFALFVQHAGIPSIDIYYGRDFRVYDTAFDSYNWMAEHGDPFFQRHVTVTGVWGLLALHLDDDSILPFNYVSYANELQLYNNMLSNFLDQKISLHQLALAIQEFASAAKEVDDELKKLQLVL